MVDVYGSDFVNGATVKFCTASATNVIFRNSSWLRCTTPANAVGACTVKVTNPNAQEGALTGRFTYQ